MACLCDGPGWIRTTVQRIMSPLLYPLSYRPGSLRLWLCGADSCYWPSGPRAGRAPALGSSI